MKNIIIAFLLSIGFSCASQQKTNIITEKEIFASIDKNANALLKDPEGYAKKRAEGGAKKEQSEANKGIKALNDEDNFWQNPEDALRKFKEDFKERRKQIMLKELIDPYY